MVAWILWFIKIATVARMKNRFLFSNFISVFLNKPIHQFTISHSKTYDLNLLTFIHKNEEKYGYILEFIERLLKLLPMPGQVSYSSWTTTLDRARSGVFNGVLAPARSEATDFIFPAEALGGGASVFSGGPTVRRFTPAPTVSLHKRT